MIRRLVWFFVISCVVAYAVFLAAGSSIQAQAIDASRIVKIRDSLNPGVHHLSGIVMVPTTCSELSVRTEQLSIDTYQIIFTTWKEPAIECITDDTARPFRAVVFAPAAGVHFVATLDDSPLDLAVYQVVDHTN